MATIVKTNFMRKFCPRQFLRLYDVVNKLYHIHSLIGCITLVVYDVRMKEPNIGGTRSAGCHNIIVLSKELVIVFY